MKKTTTLVLGLFCAVFVSACGGSSATDTDRCQKASDWYSGCPNNIQSLVQAALGIQANATVDQCASDLAAGCTDADRKVIDSMLNCVVANACAQNNLTSIQGCNATANLTSACVNAIQAL